MPDGSKYLELRCARVSLYNRVPDQYFLPNQRSKQQSYYLQGNTWTILPVLVRWIPMLQSLGSLCMSQSLGSLCMLQSLGPLCMLQSLGSLCMLQSLNWLSLYVTVSWLSLYVTVSWLSVDDSLICCIAAVSWLSVSDNLICCIAAVSWLSVDDSLICCIAAVSWLSVDDSLICCIAAVSWLSVDDSLICCIAAVSWPSASHCCLSEVSLLSWTWLLAVVSLRSLGRPFAASVILSSLLAFSIFSVKGAAIRYRKGALWPAPQFFYFILFHKEDGKLYFFQLSILIFIFIIFHKNVYFQKAPAPQ